jgi:hypothetical protein
LRQRLGTFLLLPSPHPSPVAPTHELCGSAARVRRYTRRMTASDPFTGDPFLEAFDRLPDSQLLKEQHVAALTQISPTWFQKRRAEGRTPPVWVAPTPDLIRYPVGPLRAWLADLLMGTAAHTETTGADADHEGAPASVRADPRGRLSKAEIAALQLPTLTGGRRKSKHPSFSSFLAMGMPADEWLFELSGPNERPVDFIAALELDLADGGECLWLSLAQFTDRLNTAVPLDGADSVRKSLETSLSAGPAGRPYGGMRDR